jgi:transmembrane sensor
MIKQADIDKLQRFRQGLSDEDEAQYIRFLFSENENNRGFEQYFLNEFNEYFNTSTGEDHNSAYLLDRIHHIIHKRENPQKQTAIKRIYKWYSAAAALFLIPLLLAGGIWFARHNQEGVHAEENPVKSTLFAPMGSRISFSLPDGTRGWLNSGSSIEYQVPFSGNRQVAITGEAWLDVAHDDQNPFEIKAGDSKVKVMGTKFNICAYPEDKYVEVVLEEGKVEFTASGLLSGVELRPDERLVFARGIMNIYPTHAAKYAAWKEGKLVFRGDPMAEVARRIERWYNVNVELVDKDLEKHTIRGTFQDDSLEEVFRYLSMTTPIRYRVMDRKILDDGTWERGKVLVYHKKI